MKIYSVDSTESREKQKNLAAKYCWIPGLQSPMYLQTN